jgi:hypothetical protein
MTPYQLYEWAQSSIHNLNFDFVTEMYTKKKRVCYQVDLQQLKLYVNSAAPYIYAGYERHT